MRLSCALTAVALLFSTGCYRGPDPNLTESGKGRPDVIVEAPPEAGRGDKVTAVVRVTNPGPGDMESIVVAFSRIGDPQLPTPIVEVGRGGRTDGIADVTPEPVAISQDAVIYRFGGLTEGTSTEITFELVMPQITGEVGNAVTVYDGAEPERARGARLALTVR